MKAKAIIVLIVTVVVCHHAGAWGLVKGEVKDPAAPKVLLIGDSILGGYHYAAMRALEGRATVDLYANPYNQSHRIWHEELRGILASNGPYAVIHFNLGLHGWRKGDIPEGQFEALTLKCLETINQGAPGAVVIWASTTPVVTTNTPPMLDPEVNPVIIGHNAMAKAVMDQHGIPIDDLYTLMVSHLEMTHGDRFHWNGEGCEVMGKAVARAVEAQLPAPVHTGAPTGDNGKPVMMSVTLVNEGAAPAKLKASFEAQGFTIAPAVMDQELAAGAVLRIPVTLRAATPR